MTPEILLHLNWHAGLHHEGPKDSPSVSDCTWLPNKKTSAIEVAVGDVFTALSKLNLELNGSTPSISTAKPDEIPRQLVFAVERIRSMLAGAANRSKDTAETARFLRLEKRIGSAWGAIIAGDIDDLAEYADNQEWAGNSGNQ